MTDEREIVFWSCDDAPEELSSDCREDAIEQHLDDLYDPKLSQKENNDALPDEIEVYGYARMDVMAKVVRIAARALDKVLEDLDEEFSGPYEPYTKPTEKMQAYAETFARAIAAEYNPWMCERVCTETVNVMEWIKENNPEWLVPDPTSTAPKF
jgi:hypothetical protein